MVGFISAAINYRLYVGLHGGGYFFYRIVGATAKAVFFFIIASKNDLFLVVYPRLRIHGR
jgi:hypothetical protein